MLVAVGCGLLASCCCCCCCGCSCSCDCVLALVAAVAALVALAAAFGGASGAGVIKLYNLPAGVGTDVELVAVEPLISKPRNAGHISRRLITRVGWNRVE